MTHLDYVNVCRAVNHGEDRKLENHKNHLIGEVLSCNADYFNVKIGEGWQVWSREDCDETAPTMGVEANKTSKVSDWII